jgi:hypothetical protein
MWVEILRRAFKSRCGTMWAWFATLLQLLCLLPILSSSGCDHTTRPNQGTWTISGKTYLLGSAEPLSGVKVTCAGMSTTSGPDGSYEFRGVPEGTQTITAEKENCEGYSHSVEVTSDRKFYIYLSLKTARLWGYITNVIDGPIPGARVEIHDLVDYTDASGAYELPNVPRWSDTLSVTHPDYTPYKTALSLDTSETRFDVVVTRDRIIEGVVTEDTYVYEYLPNANYSASQYLYLSTNGSNAVNQRRHIYMKFAFPELLRDERISVLEASLRLSIYLQPPSVSYQTYAVASSWSDATLRFPTQPALGVLLASGSVGGGPAGAYYSVLGTDGLNRLLQDWRANRPIYGVTIQGGPEWPGLIGFYSTEGYPYPPKLTFVVHY